MSAEIARVEPSSKYRALNQPTLIYDIHKPWEEVVAHAPIWLGTFPKKPTEKKYILFGEPAISEIIIAAGPASGQLWTDFFLEMGYGAVIEKTRRTVERKSNQLHNIAIVCDNEPLTPENLDIPRIATLNPADWEMYHNMTNSFGNPSSSIPIWTSEFRRQLQLVKDGQVLAISVTPTVESAKESPKVLRTKILGDVLIAVGAAVGAGARAVELNYACPNVLDNSVEGEMFQDAQLVGETFRAVRKYFPEVFIGMKVGLFKDALQRRFVLGAAGENIDFYSTINALSVPVLDYDGKPILTGRAQAGTCGDILRNLSLRQTQDIADDRLKMGLGFEIHAGGGITKPEHIEMFRSAGGDGFFSGSAVLANPLLNNDYFYWLQENQQN